MPTTSQAKGGATSSRRVGKKTTASGGGSSSTSPSKSTPSKKKPVSTTSSSPRTVTVDATNVASALASLLISKQEEDEAPNKEMLQPTQEEERELGRGEESSSEGGDEYEEMTMTDESLRDAEELLMNSAEGGQPIDPALMAELLAADEDFSELKRQQQLEIAAYEAELKEARLQAAGNHHVSGTAATKSAASTGTDFTFAKLVKQLLPPEVAHQDSDVVAEALLEVTSARLDDLGMEDTEPLECLTNLVHLHLQRNRIVSLSGLEFMMSLSVLLLRGNRIQTLEPVTLLPIRVLDVAENDLQGPLLEAVNFLPFETLEVLWMESNPCTVPQSQARSYVEEEEEDEESTGSVRSYRDAVLSAAPFLKNLDQVAVSRSERLRNNMDLDDGDDDSGADNAAAGENKDGEKGTDAEQKLLLGDILVDEGAMETNIKDSDFLLGEDQDDEHQEKPAAAATGTPGELPNDEEDENGSRQADAPTSSSRTKAAAKMNIADGVVSKAKQMNMEMLERYRQQLREKERLADLLDRDECAPSTTDVVDDNDDAAKENRGGLVSTPTKPPSATTEVHVDPTSGESRTMDVDEDELLDLIQRHKNLRQEMRQMSSHQSHVANAEINALWRSADDRLDSASERAAERRRKAYYEQSAPSAAYRKALDLLQQSAGTKNLDTFRKAKATKANGTTPSLAPS